MSGLSSHEGDVEPTSMGEVPSAHAHANILVVEDEHLVALDIQLSLARLGHTATVAYSGEEALDRLANDRFDLVLMDVKLRGALDGIATAHTIRNRFDLPLVYLTAYADSRTLERARATEPYGYMMKPFQERELEASIEMALQRHTADRMRRELQRLQRFLADASARMAESLDYRAVARGAAELLVPRYADWCSLHLEESDESIPAFAYTHPNGEHIANVRAPPLLDAVLRSVQPELRSDVDDRALVDALGADHLVMLRSLGARSLVCVPLAARGHVLGALAVVGGRDRPHYTASDLLFVEDFGQRLTMALDNALLYRKAERAIRIRDDVLAIVSHDLRTPLGTILMQAEVVAEHPELRKVGHSIESAAKRMNRLIGDLLDASAINAGQLTLEQGTHSAIELVREVSSMFRSQAEARELQLVEELPADALNVICDRDRIDQVLANLIGNAVKFTPKGGTVTVSANRQGNYVRVDVRDTGRGIPPEQIAHLFERFWRGKAQRDGAGLGLFIARAIVAAHGSALGVDTAIGKGSRFHFLLPAAPS